MRIRKLTHHWNVAIAATLLFLFVLAPRSVFSYELNNYNLNTATERWAEATHDPDIVDAESLSNRQVNQPLQGQPFDFQTNGAITQGGAGSGSGGGGALHTFSPQVESQMRTGIQEQASEMIQGPFWNHMPLGANHAPIDNSKGPRGPIARYTQPVMGTVTSQNRVQAALRQNVKSAVNGSSGVLTAGQAGTALTTAAQKGGHMDSKPGSAFAGGQAGMHGGAQAAADSLADAFDPTWLAMLELQMETLINVANEASGSPASAYQPTKTHQNAVWFVQRMYEAVYIPMAVLLLLPGAVLTQMKGYVSYGILGGSDEDSVSPFTGILRGMIAVFLIPATQVILSYCIDVGNSLTYEVSRYVNPITIFLWADEQVFRAPIENARNAVMNPSIFPVLGKLSQGAEQLSGVEAQSTATVMLQTLANGMAESAAFGLVMLCAFQITMVCYLMLLGPVAAAMYAWPSGIGQMFNRVFSVWVDAVVNLSLWKFWWTVVLLCIDTRLGWLGALGGFSLFSEWELLMFIAFLVILTYVPFNPFDFKAGEMVSQILQKAEGAVSEASQGGKK